MSIPDRKPPNFNWVRARLECSPAVIFSQLQDEARTSVEERNAVLPAGEEQFRIAPGAGAYRSFWIVRDGAPPSDLAAVEFSLKPDGTICVESRMRTIISATLTLDDDGECRLKVDGKALDRWQVLRMALEDFFFHS